LINIKRLQESGCEEGCGHNFGSGITVVDREENMLQKLKNNNKKVSYFIYTHM
jgi:hypothetical protein